MACDSITLGRREGCKNTVGGLKAVYFIHYNDAPYSDIVFDSTDVYVVETINSTPSTVDAFKYELKGNSSFDQKIVSSRENGTTFIEQTLTLSLKQQDIKTHEELLKIAHGRPKVIVEDNNNNMFVVGIEHGADVTDGGSSSGAAMGDFNGYTLTLVGNERSLANFMDATSESQLAAAGLDVVVGL